MARIECLSPRWSIQSCTLSFLTPQELFTFLVFDSLFLPSDFGVIFLGLCSGPAQGDRLQIDANEEGASSA